MKNNIPVREKRGALMDVNLTSVTIRPPGVRALMNLILTAAKILEMKQQWSANIDRMIAFFWLTLPSCSGRVSSR